MGKTFTVIVYGQIEADTAEQAEQFYESGYFDIDNHELIDMDTTDTQTLIYGNVSVSVVEYTADSVLVCDTCNSRMIPNISTDDGDGEGCGWTCTSPTCSEYAGSELEVEDLVACGCPAWLADRLVAIIDGVHE
jgi:hypothetical protein